MNLRFAANIFDEIGDFEMADYIDGLLVRKAQISDVDQYNMDVDAYNKKLYQQQQPAPKANLKLTKPLSFPLGVEKVTIPANVPAQNKVQAPSKKVPMGNFDKSINLMLGLEGGKTDEGSDRGGRTNYGITQFTYNAWNKKHKLPKKDVFTISPDIAKQIYKEEYWSFIKGDQLPRNVANAILSMALTDGPQDSVRFIQRLLNIEQTGFMGPKTLAAIWSKCKKDDKMFTKQILDAQIKRYKSDEQADTYGKGWTNRADLVAENID